MLAAEISRDRTIHGQRAQRAWSRRRRLRFDIARREEIEQRLSLTNPDSALVVELKRVNGRMANRREAYDVEAFPTEVVMPLVGARIVEWHHFLKTGAFHLDAI